MLPSLPLPRFASMFLVLAAAAGCAKAPAIHSFSASTPNLPYGQSALLSWEVTDAASYSIEGYSGEIAPGATSVTIQPTVTTTYVLTATGPGGTARSEPVTVRIVPRFDFAAGTYSGGSIGTTVAFVLRGASGALPAGDTAITITPPSSATSSTPFNVTCLGGKVLCLVVLPDVQPATGTYTATATVDGVALARTFPVQENSRLVSAGPVIASQSGPSAIQASWSSVTGAFTYRAQPVNLTRGGAAAGDAQILTGTSATLTTYAAIIPTERYGVVVEASVLDLSLTTAPGALPAPNLSRAMGQLGGAPNGWQLFTPSRYSGNTLTVNFTDLDPSEHLAVIVMNLGSVSATAPDSVSATLSVTGTLALPPPPQPAPLPPAPPEPELRRDTVAHELEREEEANVVRLMREGGKPAPRASVALAAAPATTNFCVRVGTGTTYVPRNATLKRETAHAVFYVDDGDLSQYTALEPGIWTSLESSWETKVYPGDTATFGAESDVDANGKLIIFLSGQLGAPVGGAILLGYYSANDAYNAKDTTTGCTGNKSNHADMFYLNSIGNVTSGGLITSTDAINRVYPDTLAHEFQHLINFNQHCLARTCTTLEDTWINEGLSMVAEEIGGFGWNDSTGRSQGARYMDRNRTTSGIESYDRRSLTKWESDPIGNYEGTHAFFRYYADRMGNGVLKQLVQTSLTGEANLQNALGLTFPYAVANWTTALMFSNEGLMAGSPGLFDYTGAAWTPLHTKLRYLNYVSLNAGGATASLRINGWNAFMTGSAAGSAATVTVTVTSTQTLKPHVLVIRYSGFVPAM